MLIARVDLRRSLPEYLLEKEKKTGGAIDPTRIYIERLQRLAKDKKRNHVVETSARRMALIFLMDRRVNRQSEKD